MRQSGARRARLKRSFFSGKPVAVAEALVGCHLFWHGLEGVIVETEAYSVRDDPACHTARRPSARAFIASHPAGSAYVYFNYGMHWMLNVLIRGEEDGFVLLRALEPTKGIEEMKAARGKTALRDLCSGPGKLARALGVTGHNHGIDLCSCPFAGFRSRGKTHPSVATGPRVGISAAKDLPWRFWIADCEHVSR